MAEAKSAEAPAVKGGGAVGKITNAASAFALTLEPVEQPAAKQAKGPQPALFYAFDPPAPDHL